MSQVESSKPKRIVVLGGGIASLAAAWRLSADDDAEITVYQRGWRLGGKGASSRGEHARIEEHGLHVWLGYYDNAFRLMRECYDELDRPRSSPDCPILAWTDAFTPSTSVGLRTRSPIGWHDWLAEFSTNDRLPGEPEISNDPMTPAAFVARGVRLLQDFFASLPDGQQEAKGRIVISASPRPPSSRLPLAVLASHALNAALAVSLEALRQAENAISDLGGDRDGVDAAVGLLDELRARLAALVAAEPARQQTFELVDLMVTNVRGVLVDGLTVHPRGFAAANGEDYREWLSRHGAATTTRDSALVLGVYDLVFGFRDGDPDAPSFGAGTGLFLAAKLFLDYRGSIFWKMQAGMGDVVFAPLYETLRKRGVRFEFFHEVDDLLLSDDNATVDRIRLVRQAELVDGLNEYDPLATFGGLPCFPVEPQQDQLAAPVAGLLRTETLWGRPPAAEPVELQHGVDFDVAIFGISLGMVPHTCSQLIERNDSWRAMTEKLGTVATQAVQLWLRSDEERLGWIQSGATVTGYPKPFDTASSMSHLLRFEEWPEGEQPASVVYLCNTLPEKLPPGRHATSYLDEQQSRVRRHAVDFLASSASRFIPGAYDDGHFQWNELVGAGDALGPDRFDSQFWTANVDPSDRYVQSLPGTDRFRLRPDGSGYSNLFLAGDWTDCGLNAGCIEAAVISGLQAANAVLGRDRWNAISGDWAGLAAI